MLRDSINIDNFNYNPVDMKKTGKTSNYHFFCPTCAKKGQYGSHPKQKTFFFFFFSEIMKVCHKLLKNVLFYQNVIHSG